jgi:hypothetical protein
MPPHSSHILQPLDVVCFSPLKRKYSQRVRDLARRRVFHINKEGFLPAFKDAFFDVFTEENCRKAFEAAGLVPINAQVVLDRLEVRLRTPPEPLLPETPWQSKTPSNTHEFGSQSKLVRESFTRSPVTAQTGFSQLVKGAELMLHQNALLVARIHEVEERLAVMTKRKSRKGSGSSRVGLWSIGLQQRRLLLRRLQGLSDQRRLVVVVIKNQRNQLYGAVGTVVGLDTTRERAKSI